MREIIISKNEEGYKLRKLCSNFLSAAPDSFIYKMLRKKNIKLNDKKADGTEILKVGDSVKFYLSEDTISSFQKNGVADYSSGDSNDNSKTGLTGAYSENIKYRNNKNSNALTDPKNIIYEDDDILLVYKPSGILSQKAKPQDYSINEMIIDYLLQTGSITEESLQTFRPSVCNRLDRNTSGIILAGKTPKGSRYLSQIIKDRSLKKYYKTVVVGKCDLSGVYRAQLIKDSKTNKVSIYDIDYDINNNIGSSGRDAVADIKNRGKKEEKIETAVEVLDYNKVLDVSTLRIELITGKSHQIRAHLAHLGFPIVGDVKYGRKDINALFRDKYGINSQMLEAYEVIFPDGRIFKLESVF